MAADFQVNLSSTGDRNSSCFVPFEDERCTIGDAIGLSFTTPEDTYLGIADATIDGSGYESVTLQGTWQFDATPLPLTESMAQGFTRGTTSFAFAGLIRGLLDGSEVFQLNLTGSGQALLPLYREGNTVLIEDSGVTYLFEGAEAPAPVPEPASMLLLGTGLAGIALRRSRRRRTRA